jgi:hypothetical protein
VSLVTLVRLRIAAAREEVADMDYQWACANAPELAAHKLRALHRAKRARILAAACRPPRISADALVLIVCLVAAPPAVVVRFLEIV